MKQRSKSTLARVCRIMLSLALLPLIIAAVPVWLASVLVMTVAAAARRRLGNNLTAAIGAPKKPAKRYHLRAKAAE